MRDKVVKALIAGDVDQLRRMWSTFFPDQPQPRNREEAEVQMHAARTISTSMPKPLRFSSHRWLKERSYPSLLPEELRPEAENFTPEVASGVGFSWNSQSAILAPAKGEVQEAVEAKIMEMDADGLVTADPDRVRKEMMLAKNRRLFELFGNFEKAKGRTSYDD